MRRKVRIAAVMALLLVIAVSAAWIGHLQRKSALDRELAEKEALKQNLKSVAAAAAEFQRTNARPAVTNSTAP